MPQAVPSRGGIRMGEPAIAKLKTQIRGEVIIPGEERYDEARKVYNAMIDRRPSVIVRCTGVADVIAAGKAARALGVSVAVRGGGHRGEGGCTGGDFNHATHAFGLATTGGIISTTGIAGLTLGGGIGYLTRGLGLSLDNLVSADVVLADGSFVNASEKKHADLFWALRGGGGNFGVVTSFEFRLYPIRDILAGI